MDAAVPWLPQYTFMTGKRILHFLLFLINHNNMEFDVLKAVITKISTFWSVTPCRFLTNQMAKDRNYVLSMCSYGVHTNWLATTLSSKLAVLLRIRAVPDSSLSQRTGYPDIFVASLSIAGQKYVSPHTRPRPLPSSPCLLHTDHSAKRRKVKGKMKINISIMSRARTKGSTLDFIKFQFFKLALIWCGKVKTCGNDSNKPKLQPRKN